MISPFTGLGMPFLVTFESLEEWASTKYNNADMSLHVVTSVWKISH
jgi:hypothetical protein